MLIRNATLQMSATERACMDVRVMNGCVWEMGAALVKGLYESETDLCGDVLMPGRMLETPVPAADEKALRLLCGGFTARACGISWLIARRMRSCACRTARNAAARCRDGTAEPRTAPLRHGNAPDALDGGGRIYQHDGRTQRRLRGI